MMTGHAPLNEVYGFANGVFAPGALTLMITRCKYATLAEMARNGGDLQHKDVGKRYSRLLTLREWGLVRYVSALRRWELTADGWRLLVGTEAAWRLSQEVGTVFA